MFQAADGKNLLRMLTIPLFVLSVYLAGAYHSEVNAAELAEPVQACVVSRNVEATDSVRSVFARCLGWQRDSTNKLCHGSYKDVDMPYLADSEEINLQADNVSFYNEGRSTLNGKVRVQQAERIINAQTAYVYRNSKTNQITGIELLGDVRYQEPDRLMLARKVLINPRDRAGSAEDVLYRFILPRPKQAAMPGWGRASLIQRFANKDWLLKKATYTTCPPQDRSWQIEAESIAFDNAQQKGVARNATLKIGKTPIFYTPYFSFPTAKKRKSGFLMPSPGYSNVGGFDVAFPYYLNLAPNYDAFIIPHVYTRRGLMGGGEFRYLTENSHGFVQGSFLPHDRAYEDFIQNNQVQYPWLHDKSSDRWSVNLQDNTRITDDLTFNAHFQQVSDAYYLQDFSSNLSIMTKRQLLREGELNYTPNDHWFVRGMVQSYQTLQPINETPVSNIYQRLPQLLARGYYDELPLNADFSVLGQLDNFQWTNTWLPQAEGPRYYLSPMLSFPQVRPWGYFVPNVQVVGSYYEVRNNFGLRSQDFNNVIPRFNLDTGLYFDRKTRLFNHAFLQTLEPRLDYLNVPFRNQSAVPVYDSAYMIFSTDQLFRTNRFSGFDRIGDTNQLAYALTTRWLSEETGAEKASLTVGQIRYFADRRVQLCQSDSGYCQDNPWILGYLSPTADFSPVASRAVYNFNSVWSATGDYVWDPAIHGTNNGHLDLHYHPSNNHIISFGYTYLVNGDITSLVNGNIFNKNIPPPNYYDVENDPLHQASIAFAWPYSDNWSTLGAFSYNLSKNFEMMSVLGIQYDNCCWAARLMAGRTFKSLSNQSFPQYNNNVYLQVMLKGLGSVGTGDSQSVIQTFLPGYIDEFHR